MQFRISDRRKAKTWRDYLPFAALIGLVFMLTGWIDPLIDPHAPFFCGLLCVGFAGFVLSDPTVRRDTGFRLMLAFLLLAFVSCNATLLDWSETPMLFTYLLGIVFAGAIVYPLFFLLSEEKGRLWLAIFANVYFIVVVCIAALGVFCALAGITIPSVDDAYFINMSYTYSWQRLQLFCYPTGGSSYCSIAILLGCYLILQSRHVWTRVCYAVGAVAIYAALALTDGRTAILLFSACSAGLIYLLAQQMLSHKNTDSRARRVRNFVLSVCLGAVAAGVVLLGTQAVRRAVNAVVEKRETAAAAVADAAPDQDVMTVCGASSPTVVRLTALRAPEGGAASSDSGTQTQDAEADSEYNATAPRESAEQLFSLTGRTYLWSAALKTLGENPIYLLFGTTPILVMQKVRVNIENSTLRELGDLHSSYFQNLVAYGVPAFLLHVAFIAYVLFHALRVFFCGDGRFTLAQRAASLPTFYVAAHGMLETMLTFQLFNGYNNFWFFLLGGYIVVLSKSKLGKSINGKRMKQPSLETNAAGT